jgi:peptidoglycan/LPS O-acetylase OafA/YrhL
MALKRLDIQVLRGYAVLMVLLYHAGLGWAPAGYLGVDVFFVISGFLITGIIDRKLIKGEFSLVSFYVRRMQRLLPAAYVTFLLTSLAALGLLTSTELADFARQLTGAVTFTANYAIKNQAGYFDGAADLKPLLHTWTLAVEEQFYLCIPLLLLAISRRWHGLLFLVLTIGSLAGNVFAHASPETMFYTLPYRAWELSLGALAARATHFRSVSLLRRGKLHWLAWGLLGSIPFVIDSETDRIWITLIACSSTVIILMAHSFWRQGGPIIQGLKWTGDISYSLYLVHWPLFAFLNNMTLIPDQWNSLNRFVLLLISFLLGAALHYGVEAPLLLRSFSRRTVLLFSTAMAFVFLASSQWILKPLSLTTGYLELRKEDQGLGIECNSRKPYAPDLCQSGQNPRMLVWGDSMAMQLVNGLMESSPEPLTLQQATRSTCAPLLSMTYKTTPGGAKNCIDFNRSVLAELQQSESIEIVVLSARWNHYLRPNVELSVFDGNGIKEFFSDQAPEALERSLNETIQSIRSLGKRVILIDAPPSTNYDISRCIERSRRQLLTLGAVSDCAIPNDDYRQLRLSSNEIIDAVAQRLKVSILHFDEYLCSETECRTQMDGSILYRDNIHFSREGALKIMREMGLVTRIQQLAN